MSESSPDNSGSARADTPVTPEAGGTAPPIPILVRLLAAGGLFAGTLALYWPALWLDFFNLDDATYVHSNPIVKGGFTSDGLLLAVGTTHAGYWIPLTWLSLMLDCEIWGSSPFGYHLTNVLLHACTSALLFLVLGRMTRADGPSFLVAALFACHPVTVESVAWVAERKDVLSTLFMVLTFAAYCRYADRPTVPRYLLVFFCLTLGLTAKPMLVTVPVLLLLLDYWPLGRLRASSWPRLVAEKIPLLMMAGLVGWLTISGHSGGGVYHHGGVRSLDDFSLYARFSNAAVNYLAYLRMLLWPLDLAVFYPHPGDTLPPGWVVASVVLLLLVTVAAVCLARRAPFVPVGWLWYLVTITPVSGLLQVYIQGRADRFLYVPSLGVFIIVSWALARAPRKVAIPVATGVLAACLVLTRIQLGYWKDHVTLWEHTVAVTPDNREARTMLARALITRGRGEEALIHLQRAKELEPNEATVY
jgi:hypothetical protein